MPSPAQCAGAGEDEPRSGMGLGHRTASSAMNCRFIPPSQLLQSGVQLRLKERTLVPCDRDPSDSILYSDDVIKVHCNLPMLNFPGILVAPLESLKDHEKE